jgi:hypothetical protein
MLGPNLTSSCPCATPAHAARPATGHKATLGCGVQADSTICHLGPRAPLALHSGRVLHAQKPRSTQVSSRLKRRHALAASVIERHAKPRSNRRQGDRTRAMRLPSAMYHPYTQQGNQLDVRLRVYRNMVLKLSEYLYGIWAARSLSMGNIWTYGPPRQHARWCVCSSKSYKSPKKTTSSGE